MLKNEKTRHYDALKEHDGQKYTGMSVGGRHSWNYKDGTWNETKVSPNKWKFEFTCNKYRNHQAPQDTGAPNKTEFHWYIVADQKVVKLDENIYSTVMTGSKFLVSHKRPNWKYWRMQYDKESYEDKIIEILEGIIEKLKMKRKKKTLANFF